MLIIVYDITKRASFERVTDYWYKTKEILDQSVSEKPVVLLIGNKLVWPNAPQYNPLYIHIYSASQDLKDERAVTTVEGEQLAKELGMMFGELSCKQTYQLSFLVRY
jgi:GTPase SAR1 family protein